MINRQWWEKGAGGFCCRDAWGASLDQGSCSLSNWLFGSMRPEPLNGRRSSMTKLDYSKMFLITNELLV